MTAMRIVPYHAAEMAGRNRADVARGIDSIFFDASNTKSFADDHARALFRERWLGRYLDHYADFAFLAMTHTGDIAGYIVGAANDPACDARFSDIAYFQSFAHLTARYPAHLHINLARDYRGQGIGQQLIAAFIDAVHARGAPGVHVVTSLGARNIAFYGRNGFHEAGRISHATGVNVFLARDLS
ncbi:MAG: GNAT family N-acetyltransferase [Hyphomicrobium sp.]